MSKCQCGHEHTDHGKTKRGHCEKVTNELLLLVCHCVKYRKRKTKKNGGKAK